MHHKRFTSTTSSTAPRRLVRVAAQDKSYYVAMNVFKVKLEHSEDFENVWKNRESHLKEMPGFVRFAMLKCENVPGKYISQTYWQSKADFENWSKSSQFKSAHGSVKSPEAGKESETKSEDKPSQRPNTMMMLEGPPSPEFYGTVTITE